jgi:SAF domain
MVIRQQQPVAPAARTRLPAATRDRRPALAALALLLVLTGALGAALVVYRSGNRVDALVAANGIDAGRKITRADFGVTRVAADTTGIIRADAEQNFVGSYATSRIPQGTLVNRTMFRVGGVMPDGSVDVGVTLSVSQRPAKDIQAGDVVRVYVSPKTGDAASAGPVSVVVAAARVIAVQAGDISGASMTASLLLTSDEAAAVIQYATQNEVALGELPLGTSLPVDFLTG